MTDSWRALKPIERPGYQHVAPARGGVKEPFSIHRLVLEAFVGPRPQGMVCCRGDGSPANHCLDNLRWGTPKANSHEKLLQGTMCRGEAARHAKLREADVLEIRRLGAEGVTISKLATQFDVSRANVRAIVKGRSRKRLLPHEEAQRIDPEAVEH